MAVGITPAFGITVCHDYAFYRASQHTSKEGKGEDVNDFGIDTLRGKLKKNLHYKNVLTSTNPNEVEEALVPGDVIIFVAGNGHAGFVTSKGHFDHFLQSPGRKGSGEQTQGLRYSVEQVEQMDTFDVDSNKPSLTRGWTPQQIIEFKRPNITYTDGWFRKTQSVNYTYPYAGAPMEVWRADTDKDLTGTDWTAGGEIGPLVTIQKCAQGQLQIVTHREPGGSPSHRRGAVDFVEWNGTLSGTHVVLTAPASAYDPTDTEEGAARNAAKDGWLSTFEGDISADGRRIIGRKRDILRRMNADTTTEPFEFVRWPHEPSLPTGGSAPSSPTENRSTLPSYLSSNGPPKPSGVSPGTLAVLAIGVIGGTATIIAMKRPVKPKD